MTIDSSIVVHPSAQVHPSAMIGHGTVIGPHVRIGANVIIGPYCAIGGAPEHREFYTDGDGTRSKGVVIHPGVRIFEFTTIHGGTILPTVIYTGASIFNHSHVAHDCIVGDWATIGGQVSLAGHTVVLEHAIIAGKSCTHQFAVVGAYAFLAPMSFLKGDMPPGQLWVGNPARPSGLNNVGLQRANLTIEDVLKKHLEPFETLKKGKDYDRFRRGAAEAAPNQG